MNMYHRLNVLHYKICTGNPPPQRHEKYQRFGEFHQGIQLLELILLPSKMSKNQMTIQRLLPATKIFFHEQIPFLVDIFNLIITLKQITSLKIY
ncbi:hypothetical protein BVL54_09585 [Bacillus paralicheniformis]|nr:hypothetical protein BVL54_09585 [Bacillus paralicheniformis]